MNIETIKWEDDTVKILDQTKLPHTIKFIKCRNYKDVVLCIKDMKIRGAPAIGIASAYGIALWAKSTKAKNFKEFQDEFERICKAFINSRQTAVNIRWAVERMKFRIKNSELRIQNESKLIKEIKQLLIQEAKNILREDIEINKKIGRYGADLICNGDKILTHCNTGSLATGGWGTALGVIRTAWRDGKNIIVYVDETRPYLQGARLTAFELKQEAIPFYLICDNMAGYLMQLGEINKIIVGADRVAINGDVANKIGTYSLAVLAKENKVPFYVAAPLSSIDIKTKSGKEIPIEERGKEEVINIFGKKITLDEIDVRNPAFDITPNKYITAIITEKGIIKKPFKINIKRLCNDLEK